MIAKLTFKTIGSIIKIQMKMISTLAITTAANLITACHTNTSTSSTIKTFRHKLCKGHEFYDTDAIKAVKDLIIPTLSGFVASTIPAIGLNIINGVFFKISSSKKEFQYAAMGGTLFLSKDLYADILKSQLFMNVDTGLGENIDECASWFLTFSVKGLSNLACYTGVYNEKIFRSDIEVAIKDALNSNDYAINTAAQTLLLDWIWCDNGSSIEHPEL
jgi:hypothetical protein